MPNWNSPDRGGAAIADRLRLRQLKLLMEIGEQGTLGRASTALNVTQPTATKMLADCETIVGMPLYDRTPRGLCATPSGREMLVFARRVMAEYERVRTALETQRTGGGGDLVIGAILGATPDLIARAVIEMKEAEPHLTIKLRGETSDQVLAMLENRSLDLAVGRYSNATQHNIFHYEPLGDEALCIIARAAHPLARRRSLRLQDLAGQRWVMQPIETPSRPILETEFGKAGMSTPGDMIEANSVLTIIHLVQHSDAIAMLSEPQVRIHLASGLLRCLPVRIQARLGDFGLLTRRNEVLTGAAARFAQRLRALPRA